MSTSSRPTPSPATAERSSLWRDSSLSTLTAGFIAVLIGYSSSAAIIVQAAEAAGASQAEIGSWLWALGIGSGITTLVFSLRYRMPLLTAWSTPGAALLATSLPGLPMSEAIGAFLFSSLLITLCGVTGLFERLMHRLPRALASAMLAGVLLRFGLDLVMTVEHRLVLPLAMGLTYLVAKRLWPRYAIPLVLAVGGLVAQAQGLLDLGAITPALAVPAYTAPSFDLGTLIGVGIPLFVVTMASQNLPGVAALRAAGYQPPISPLVGGTGLAGLALAPFGGFALNLAAISAAVCQGPEAHHDPRRRYAAGVAAGGFYLLLGLFGATVSSLFAALPGELVVAIAGLALLPTLGASLADALGDVSQRDAALLTFLVTASGIAPGGIGSAFWGLVAGLVALAIGRWRAAGNVA
ncbi:MULTISPECIES: benzoate/H(+) symporter BenE family transporter [Halomonas]|uniref:Benzoate transporter n=1 Tax=Halomonas halophila TaxID=29573 RepID=A0ABQ0U1H7_9GAMM|nr:MULTISPECIES: benzoate/H(+) symporter BenE family transporter [Halomonas]MDR5889428.1 benzoate/H(+) symporter BenE family transporter [Halomonas salina]WJY06113.1 benzoate/H(+) symporter BenE family transporter [Halomonas halophila]GEK72383.1 benzoate transporter [Halomonas halophila]